MPLVDEHFSLVVPYQTLHNTPFVPQTQGLIQETREHTQLSAIKTTFLPTVALAPLLARLDTKEL